MLPAEQRSPDWILPNAQLTTRSALFGVRAHGGVGLWCARKRGSSCSGGMRAHRARAKTHTFDHGGPSGPRARQPVRLRVVLGEAAHAGNRAWEVVMDDEAGEGNHRHARILQLAQLHFFSVRTRARARSGRANLVRAGSKKGFDEPVFLKL